jgi:hypothetical protein
MTTLKQVFDKLLDAVSASSLAPIALKVAAKYNDGAVADTLNLEKDITKIADDLFASSDRAFIEGLVGGEDYKDIADEVGFEIVEGFNN